MTRYVSYDGFAFALDEMLEDFADATSDEVQDAVRRATYKGRAAAKELSPKCHPDGYATGWRSRVTKNGYRTTGEIGNKLKPGLVHLLEKGHSTIGGGRVEGRPHLAPAAERAFAYLLDMLGG